MRTRVTNEELITWLHEGVPVAEMARRKGVPPTFISHRIALLKRHLTGEAARHAEELAATELNIVEHTVLLAERAIEMAHGSYDAYGEYAEMRATAHAMIAALAAHVGITIDEEGDVTAPSRCEMRADMAQVAALADHLAAFLKLEDPSMLALKASVVSKQLLSEHKEQLALLADVQSLKGMAELIFSLYAEASPEMRLRIQKRILSTPTGRALLGAEGRTAIAAHDISLARTPRTVDGGAIAIGGAP